MIPVPYMVRGTIRSYMWGTIRYLFHIRYGGDPKSHSQLQGSHIPYKVWGTIRVIHSYKVPTFHIRYGVHKSHSQLQGSHIPYKVWGYHKSH